MVEYKSDRWQCIMTLSFPALVTEALVMWTSRFGLFNSESTEKHSRDVTLSKNQLELEIKMNGEQVEGNNDIHLKRNNYNHYVPESSYNRKPRKLSNRKLVTIDGDGRFSEKKVFR